MMPVDVPAYVQEAPHVRNNVQVQTSANWDMSRVAIPTPIERVADQLPIYLLEEPAPVAVVPAAPENLVKAETLPTGEALTVLQFLPDATAVGPKARTKLQQLPKGGPLFVVGWPDAAESDTNRLVRTRIKAVTEYLRGKGYQVEGLQVADPDSELQLPGKHILRSVEIYAAQ